MSGWIPYVVRPGDYIDKLAHRHGFDADAVWNDDSNAELRETRSDPRVLSPGDLLHIPDPADATGSDLTTGSTNEFTSNPPTVPVALSLEHDEQPVANTECVIHGLPTTLKVTTDGNGSVRFDVPVTTESVTLIVPTLGIARKIKVGHIDPVNERSGIVERLRNMGYLSPETEETDLALALTSAVRDFQTDSGLPETGDADDATVQQIAKKYGC